MIIKLYIHIFKKNLGSTMLRATNDDMECGMWNMG
jgi:hypothetical protein